MLTTLKHQEKGENIIERPHKSYFCNSFAGPSVSVFIEHMSGQCSDAGEDFLFQEADDQTEVIVCVWVQRRTGLRPSPHRVACVPAANRSFPRRDRNAASSGQREHIVPDIC